MPKLISQYFRDLKTLLNGKFKISKFRMFWIYHRLVFVNIFFTKIFKTNPKSFSTLGFTFHFDSFNSFFAMFTEIFIYQIYHFTPQTKTPKIIDAGANIGIATLYFKHLFPKCQIDAFEPDPGTFHILEKNIISNDLENVTAHQKAVGDKTGHVTFFSYGGFDGSPGNTLHQEFINFPKVKEYKVEMFPLSSLHFSHLDYLKIDVEGAEGLVFKDLETHHLLPKIDAINLEFHYHFKDQANHLSDLLQSLEKHHFHFLINPCLLKGDSITLKDYQTHQRYVLILNAFKTIK